MIPTRPSLSPDYTIRFEGGGPLGGRTIIRTNPPPVIEVCEEQGKWATAAYKQVLRKYGYDRTTMTGVLIYKLEKEDAEYAVIMPDIVKELQAKVQMLEERIATLEEATKEVK